MPYNILQTNTVTGNTQTMLGCNVDLDTAKHYLDKYQGGLPETNANRAKHGNPPLTVTYEIIEAEGEYQDWLPGPLKCGRLPYFPGYHASNRRYA